MSEFALLGRDDEVEVVMRLVRSGTSGLIVVSGAVGMGKSAFLRLIVALAATEGWMTRDGASFVIEGSTKPEPFEAAIFPRLHSGPASALAAANTIQVETDPAQSWQGDRTQDGQGVLVAVDEFRPSASFETWFVASLLPRLAESTPPILLIVGEVPHRVRQITPAAVAHVTLGPLRADVVREHFESMAASIDPPLTARELSAYAKAGRPPYVLAAITRLLLIVGRTTRAGGGSTA